MGAGPIAYGSDHHSHNERATTMWARSAETYIAQVYARSS